MKSPIIVASEEHVDAICRLEELCFPTPWNKKQFLEALHAENYRLYVYCTHDLLAYLLVSKVGDYCEIVNIATHPNYRKKGCAQALLQYFFALETMKDVHTVLEVRSQNIAAQELYKKFGFQQIHVRKGYYQDNGDDALVMERA